MEFPDKAPDDPGLAVIDKINAIPTNELKFLVFGLFANLTTSACDMPKIGQIMISDIATHPLALEFQKLLIRHTVEKQYQAKLLDRVQRNYVIGSHSN